MHCLNILLWTAALFLPASGLGCMPKICEGNDQNELVSAYNSARQSGEIAQDVTLKCNEDSAVYAPFDGNMSFWRSYEGMDKRCDTVGVKISGTGQWQGYIAYITPVVLNFYNGYVERGSPIGWSKNYGCVDDVANPPHIMLKLRRGKSFIDPTYHLRECMCTGQICETNLNNAMLHKPKSKPFHFSNAYNGVFGWEIKCTMVEKSEDQEARAPEIKSPIDAKWVGRTRLYSVNGDYTGCDNNGLVLLGAKDWEDYEVRLYNVVYAEEILGQKTIVQGQKIGSRLQCDNSPDSIFMEVRYRGTIVDITDLISANLCKKPEFKM